MADKFTNFLSNVGAGMTNPKGNLGDFKHASRLYVDNNYSRAPRTKFMYHVYFEINQQALRNSTYAQRHLKEPGMLVKMADLPKFTFESEVKNQYNKKKIVYKSLNYDPVNITFHDDNQGIINAMWALYYGYYSEERSHPPTAWNQKTKSTYYKSEGTLNTTRYGLDRDGVVESFFRSITIYTMARKRFNSYKLINPMIKSWNHGSVDQSQSNGTMESTMTLEYESVVYGAGEVTKGGAPLNFSSLHYDNVPSPLSLGGGVVSNVLGAGGLLDQLGLSGETGVVAGAKEIFGTANYQDALTGDLFSRQNLLKAVNFYKSVRSISKESLLAEATNIILTPGKIESSVSGLAGIRFPRGK